MRPPFLALAAALALLLAAYDRLEAASVGTAADLCSLVRGAELIAEFELLDARPELLPDGTIQTAYTFATLTPMKGRPASICEVRMPGGEIAGRGLLVPGLPDFQIGDRHILFLCQQGETKPWRLPVGLSAGAFRVVGGTAADARVVARSGEAEEDPDVQNYREFVAAILEEVARQS